MGLDKKTLVVKSDIIFGTGHWQGLKRENLGDYLELIKNNYQFIMRGEVENDISYQQIIPYIIFSCQNKYFLYHYLEKSNEPRLKDDWILGVGGHIDLVDAESSKNILETGMMREWQEEIDYKGRLIEKKLIGILNDETRTVEAVHLGLVYHFKGDSLDIRVKEQDVLEGALIDFGDLPKYIKNTGGWAPIVWRDYLSKI